MAAKRMFDRAIIDTDRFMDLPISSKALYFLLGMEADDEGFVSYKKVMRVHGGSDDDMRTLALKKFIIPFPSGVVVITDWNKNNYLDVNRVKPTEYQKEKKSLLLTDKGEYVLNKCSTSIEEYSIEESILRDDSEVAIALIPSFPKKEILRVESSKEVNEPEDDGVDIVVDTECDMETGEPVVRFGRTAKKPKVNKRDDAFEVVRLFGEACERELKVRPFESSKDYFVVVSALKKMDRSNLPGLVKWWFKETGLPNDKLIQIRYMFSTDTLNRYQSEKGVDIRKPKV